MTLKEFYECIILEIGDSLDHLSYDTFLLSLHNAIISNQHLSPNFDNFLFLIKSTATTEPSLFDTKWNEIIDPKFTINSDNVYSDNIIESHDLDSVLNIIRINVAEYYPIKEQTTDSLFRINGVVTLRGNTLYNLDPYSVLECGTSCLIAHIRNIDKFVGTTWATLAYILDTGQFYE